MGETFIFESSKSFIMLSYSKFWSFIDNFTFTTSNSCIFEFLVPIYEWVKFDWNLEFHTFVLMFELNLILRKFYWLTMSFFEETLFNDKTQWVIFDWNERFNDNSSNQYIRLSQFFLCFHGSFFLFFVNLHKRVIFDWKLFKPIFLK